MKTNTKWTVLALAVSAVMTSGVAFAADDEDKSANIDHQHNVRDTRLHSDVNINKDINVEKNTTVNKTMTADTKLSLDASARMRSDSNTVREDIQRSSDVTSNETKEKNNHGVDVNLEKDLRLSSDIEFSGSPTISGDINLDSAAIAIIDNRQSVSQNVGINEHVDNTASIGDDVATNASGNLQFNTAAGDNNAQDNAASLSAADASFSFGLADAEVFVNQQGFANQTMNSGVANNASVSGAAFANASGNIGVNVTSGNNNEQKNALAASVATSAYAQSSISSNQVSTGNAVHNSGLVEERTSSTDVTLTGTVAGYGIAVGEGSYSGSSSGSYAGRGNAYQKDNFYLDTWDGELPHSNGESTGHMDMDADIQNAVRNPYKQGVGGIAFDTDERGTYSGKEEGELGYMEIGYSELEAQLSGTVTNTTYVVADATNTASLSGSAFSSASGNIGVNVSAGTGNLQANSLALAVAQPSTGGGTPPGGE